MTFFFEKWEKLYHLLRKKTDYSLGLKETKPEDRPGETQHKAPKISAIHITPIAENNRANKRKHP
jgi:hypothetical protein